MPRSARTLRGQNSRSKPRPRHRAGMNGCRLLWWGIAGAISRAGSDGRKANNNGIAAESARPHKSGYVALASWSPAPSSAICSPPFRSHSEPDSDAESR